MNPRLDILMTAVAGALIQAQQAADQIRTEFGIDLGQLYDPERFRPVVQPSDDVPVWDADGVSQPFGQAGLVMLRELEEARARIAEQSPEAAAQMPRLVACVPGLRKAAPGSDTYRILDTEISWATFGALMTNQGEALGVNVYDIIPGDPAVMLPHQRLKMRPQEHVPGAIALPRDLTTARACAARILEYTRAKMLNDAIPDTDAIDFSPARPRPGKV